MAYMSGFGNVHKLIGGISISQSSIAVSSTPTVIFQQTLQQGTMNQQMPWIWRSSTAEATE